MIASRELKPAPRRLVLQSDAYQHIEAPLVERLALLRSQLRFTAKRFSSVIRSRWPKQSRDGNRNAPLGW
jgi:hypothetical protein